MRKIEAVHNVGGIDGLTIIIPKVFKDDRGYLMEAFNNSDLAEVGIIDLFVQDNEAFSKRNVLRGLHVNRGNPQAKLVRVLDGAIYDVVIDLRENSKTYKKWYGIELTAMNKKQLYIPEGFGHGYLALTDSRILFKVTAHWLADDEIGFAWNSKEFAIDWPVSNPIQNEKDKHSPDFSELCL